MTARRRPLHLALVLAAAGWLHCEPPPGLVDYCPDDPMAESCPGGGCSGAGAGGP